MQEIFNQLCAEFPRESVHWRAQSVNQKTGETALALAYIDARDVMDRLDLVCGPGGWQSEHYEIGKKTACKIGIANPIVSPGMDNRWVWKSDGAGDTAVEGDKGAFSDALKRAAVSWGVGRYLYDMPALWIPCESYKRNDGKYAWKKFTVDPWDKVPSPTKGALSRSVLNQKLNELSYALRSAPSEDAIATVQQEYCAVIDQAKIDAPERAGRLWGFIDECIAKIQVTEAKHREMDRRAKVA